MGCFGKVFRLVSLRSHSDQLFVVKQSHRIAKSPARTHRNVHSELYEA